MKYIRMKNRKLAMAIMVVVSILSLIALSIKLLLMSVANGKLKNEGNYGLGAPSYVAQNDANLIQGKITPDKKTGKIDYLAFGDSVAAGYDASKNKDIMGYTNVLAKYLDDVDELNSFERYAFTGITSSDLRKVVLGQMSSHDWKSLIHDDKYRTLKRFNDANGDPISLEAFRAGMISKIKSSEYITLQSGANNILNAIKVLGVRAHDLFNPSYLVEHNLVPEGTSTESAVSIYMDQKLTKFKSNPSLILSNFSEILNIDMDAIKQAIANAYSDNLKMINFIHQNNEHAKITVVGYYNPIGWLGIIQKLAGFQKIVNELNKALAASATSLNNGVKEIDVNFVANDIDFDNHDNPTESLGSRAKFYTRYDNVFKQYHTAKPTDQQILDNQIYAAGTYFPHLSDIHPVGIGQVAIARRLYAFGFKPFLASADKAKVELNPNDIKDQIDIQNSDKNSPHFCEINEHSWIIKRKYQDPTIDPTNILDDVTFAENKKYFPDNTLVDFLGDKDYWRKGKTVNQMYANIFNEMVFDGAILGAINQVAKVVIDNMGSGLVNGLSNGVNKMASNLNPTFVKFMQGQNSAWSTDENALLKFIMPAIAKLSEMHNIGSSGNSEENMTTVFKAILMGDPTSWGWNPDGYTLPSVSTLDESRALWLYADDVFNEWFQNIFNNYFFHWKTLSMGMVNDLNFDDDWASLLLPNASGLAKVEHDMIKMIDNQINVLHDQTFMDNLAKNYWDLMERNSLLEGILRAKIQGLLKGNESMLQTFGLKGEIDLRDPVLVAEVVPAVIFAPMKVILEYVNNNQAKFTDFTAAELNNLPTVIAKIDDFSTAFVASYKKLAENHGVINS